MRPLPLSYKMEVKVMHMIPKYKTHLANRQNYGGTRSPEDIKYIVLHYTANDGDHDEDNGKYFAENVVNSSAHYFVDDDSITLSVPEANIAWAVGGPKWKDCAATGGGKMYGQITNANSLSVEMCDTLRDGTIHATEQTMTNTILLVKDLMRKYNIDIDHVYRHFDVNGKHCPTYLMDEAAWAAFKERLKERDTVPVYHTINEVPEWAKPTIEKLIAHGSLKGDSKGDLNLSYDLLRMLVINDREGLYGK